MQVRDVNLNSFFGGELEIRDAGRENIMNMNIANINVTADPAQATVVTHPAPHHGDETFAVAMLALMEGRVDVFRTRNQDDINTAWENGAFICDVGGVYDPENEQFDHHQRDFEEAREDGAKYSSAGLVWKKYGADICVAATGCPLAQAEAAAKKVDEMLIRGIDVADYGERTVDQMSVSMAISVLNPNWDEPATDGAFVEACQLAYMILTRTIKSCVAVVKGQDAVEEAIGLSDGGIMILPQFIGGWIETATKSTNPKAENLLYGVFKNLQGQWNVQALPLVDQPTSQRKSFPEAWRGLNGTALQEITGVEDAVFCHAGGFICGARSQEGALALAKLAVAAE